MVILSTQAGKFLKEKDRETEIQDKLTGGGDEKPANKLSVKKKKEY